MVMAQPGQPSRAAGDDGDQRTFRRDAQQAQARLAAQWARCRRPPASALLLRPILQAIRRVQE
jgi:hypothetical protein